MASFGQRFAHKNMRSSSRTPHHIPPRSLKPKYGKKCYHGKIEDNTYSSSVCNVADCKCTQICPYGVYCRDFTRSRNGHSMFHNMNNVYRHCETYCHRESLDASNLLDFQQLLEDKDYAGCEEMLNDEHFNINFSPPSKEFILSATNKEVALIHMKAGFYKLLPRIYLSGNRNLFVRAINSPRCKIDDVTLSYIVKKNDDEMMDFVGKTAFEQFDCYPTGEMDFTLKRWSLMELAENNRSIKTMSKLIEWGIGPSCKLNRLKYMMMEQALKSPVNLEKVRELINDTSFNFEHIGYDPVRTRDAYQEERDILARKQGCYALSSLLCEKADASILELALQRPDIVIRYYTLYYAAKSYPHILTLGKKRVTESTLWKNPHEHIFRQIIIESPNECLIKLIEWGCLKRDALKRYNKKHLHNNYMYVLLNKRHKVFGIFEMMNMILSYI